MFIYSAHGLDARRFDALHFFFVENKSHTVSLNMYYSVSTASMHFRNESVFTELFLKRIRGKRIVFAHADRA